MKKLYALVLSLFVLLGLGSLSTASAQGLNYNLSQMTVRAITNTWTPIAGTEIVNLRSQYTGEYLSSEITTPFSINFMTWSTNIIRVGSAGQVYLVGDANSQSVRTAVTYDFEAIFGEEYIYEDIYDYIYFYQYGFLQQPMQDYGSYYVYNGNNVFCAWLPYENYPTSFNGTPSNVQYTTLGNAPNRQFVVQMQYASSYPYTNWGGNAIGSWQTVFVEGPANKPTTVRYYYNTDFVNGAGYWDYAYSYYYTTNYYIYEYLTPSIGVKTTGGLGGQGFISIRRNTQRPAGTVLTDGVDYTRTGYTYDAFYAVTLPTVGYEITYVYDYDLDLVSNPNPFPGQGAVRRILQTFTPTIQMSNSGKNPYSAASIRLTITELGVSGLLYDNTVALSGGQIPPPFSAPGSAVSFPSYTPTSYGVYTLRYSLISASPVYPDQNTSDDIYTNVITVSPDNDIRAVEVLNPADSSRTPVNVGTPVTLRFQNSGVLDQPSVPITAVIRNPQGQIVYRDTVVLQNWLTGQYRDTDFRTFTPTQNGNFQVSAIAILGADELRINDTITRTVLVRWEADVRAVSVVDPEDDGEKPEKKAFQPVGRFESVGVRDLFDIRARVQIRKCSDNSLIYQADSLPGIPELNIDEGQKNFAFPSKQGTFDIRNIPPGCYKICVMSLLPDDGDRTNDTACSFFSFIPRLQGNIEVGVGKRFRTVGDAVDSMKYRGIGGNLNLILTDNNYTENGTHTNFGVSTQTAAVDFSRIEGTGPNAVVTWKPKAGVFPTITFTGSKLNCFDLTYLSAPYMVFDGNNQFFVTPDQITAEPTKRAITVVNNSSTPGAIFNIQWGRNHLTFKNMRLKGSGVLVSTNSSIFTTSNVYDDNSFLFNRVLDTAANNNIVIDNNEMGNAAFGVKDVGTRPLFNIGKAAFEDRRNFSNVISRNNIGTQAWPLGFYGIYFLNEDGLAIRHNEISWVTGGGVNPSDVAAISHSEFGGNTGNSVNSLIDANKIHNIGGGLMVSGVNFNQSSVIYTIGTGANQKRSTLPVQTGNRVINNFIYDLRNGGTSINPIAFNTTVTNYTTEKDSIFNNSIAVANSASAITITQNQKPFVWNNIIQNLNIALNTNAVVYKMTVPRPWQQNISSNNNLFNMLGSSRFATVTEYDRPSGLAIQTRNIVSLNDWRTYTGQDINSVAGNPSYVTGDSLHMPSATSYIFSPASNAGAWLGTATQRFDYDGDERLLANNTPDIGADEFEGFQWNNDLGVQAILQPSGLTDGNGNIVATDENPVNIQAIVKNFGNLTQLGKKVYARIDTSMTNGANWVTIWSATPQVYDFAVSESKTVDFAGTSLNPVPNVKYRVTVYVDNDQNNSNNSLSKIFTLTVKRQAILVSYTTKNASGLADANGQANKDSVTRALRRLGIQFDSLDRSSFGANAIDYSAWWTVIWTTGNPTQTYNNTTAPGTPLGVGAVSLKETDEIINLLRAGKSYAKKSFIIAGQNIAEYNDPVSPYAQLNNSVTDLEFMRSWMHTIFKKRSPMAENLSTPYRNLLNGTGVYFKFNDSLSALSPDVVDVYPATGPVGLELTRIAYNYKVHPNSPADSGAGTAYTSPTFNVVYYPFDWADPICSVPLTENGALTSGTTRFLKGALDFIQSTKGTILPVEFVSVKGAATTNGNEITWEVAAQKNVDRYEVEVLNGDNWSYVGEVQAAATKSYSFTHNTADAFEVKDYSYRVTSVDLDGSRATSPAVTFGRTADGLGLALEQNYPNPFNGMTKIAYTLPDNGVVTIRVMDLTGKLIANVLDNAEMTGGKHDVTFTASNLATGMYVYEISFTNANGETSRLSNMMTLTK